ncbi:MAG TPA: hypothetical protein VMI10_14070 [Terriglobales bacterium]|nr:hypothetical protein [Terriglobales bacterium]
MADRNTDLRVGSTIQLSLVVSACILVVSVCSFAQSQDIQSKSATSAASQASAAPVQEFPVNMRQNVIAGKTAVGTKVEARLAIATLIKGAVIPEGAIFSGEVIDSVAKSKTDPSRLAIRMDSVQWKKESRPMRLFLTVWYYPMLMGEDADVKDRDAPTQIMQNPNVLGFPNARTPPDLFPPPSHVSETRVTMKDVESKRGDDGTVTLTSSKSNLKLDKSTTYVFANGDLGAPVKPSSANDHTK